MIDFIFQPWSWYVSGFFISLVMFLLLWVGGEFGFSSNLRTLCSICGADKLCTFFDFNKKAQYWNLIFVVGTITGGVISSYFLPENYVVQLSSETINDLQELNIDATQGILPRNVFNLNSFFTLKGFIIMIVGGFLVGFGSRWAGGCTSGHAISGLANLQLYSLVVVAGFFIGGLLMNWIILPFILTL